jgi:hypothetical protein
VGDELRRAGADPAPVLARLAGSRPATALRIGRTPEAALPDRAATIALASTSGEAMPR